MISVFEDRVKKLVEYHEAGEQHHPKKVTIELGDMHTDALQRLCILEGMTKTALIRHLIAVHVRELGDEAVMGNPSQLYDLGRQVLNSE